MTIPRSAPETAGLAQKWDVKVHDDGSATATCDMTWKGDFAVQARQMFSVEGQRPLILQQLFTAMLGKLKITNSKFDDMKDFSRPDSSFQVTIEIEKFVKGSGDTRTLPTGFVDFVGRQMASMVSQKQREHDLVISTAISFRTEAAYELPAGWTVTAPPADAKIELPSATFTSTATSDGAKLSLVRDMRLLGERVKAADYPAFREAVSKAVQTTQQQWKVKKGEAAAAPETPAPTAPAPETK
jgi:hypothetical protein